MKVRLLTLLIVIQGCDWFHNKDSAKVKLARAQIDMFQLALTTFKSDTGSLPDQETGLAALIVMPKTAAGWRGPYLSRIPVDPWGNRYVYLPTGTGLQGATIASYGADGRPGGEGFASDITSSLR